MKSTVALLALVAVLAPGSRAGAADDLLTRMASVNPDLRTYTATMHAEVAMKSIPFLDLHLVGTYYHKEPNLNKLVFSSGVPIVAQQFDKLYANIEPPSRWKDVYSVSVVGDDGTTTIFRLIPRKRGNVDHIDAKADDRTATVTWMRWNYDNGGYAEMQNRYGTVNGSLLVHSQSGHVQEPGYTADITSTFDNYNVNVPIADSVFAGE
jgi:hypothetical protein